MTSWSQRIAVAIAVAAVSFCLPVPAGAETCSLELKRLEPVDSSPFLGGMPAGDYVFRMVSPQHFFMQIMQGKVQASGGSEAEFAKVVKKEPPEYKSERPFRGVASLGDDKFGFVLDAAESEQDRYDRLLFDLNHNGDLTDDKPVKAKPKQGIFMGGYVQSEFPRVDLKISADDKTYDYSFLLSVYSYSSDELSYVSASLSAAAYRQGEIEVAGETKRVALIDYNSNGRFDDRFKILDNVQSSDGQVYPESGDMMLVDFNPNDPSVFLGYNPTAGGCGRYVSKMVNFGDRFYELDISPSGEKLTLSSASVQTGYVSNPNPGFSAVVYGDQGMMNVAADESGRCVLPEGSWRLLSYTIDQTGYDEAEDKPAAEEAGQEEEQESSLLGALIGALKGAVDKSASPVFSRSSYTMVSAQATGRSKPVEVRAGKTAVLPFGPPYRPVVKASSPARAGQPVSLELSIVGAASEVCSNLMVDGGRPKKPKFTILDADGEEVDSGSFEYG